MNKSSLLFCAVGLIVVLGTIGVAAVPISYRLDQPGHRIIRSQGKPIRLLDLGKVNRTLFWEGLAKLVTHANTQGRERKRSARALTARSASPRVRAMITYHLLTLQLEGIGPPMAFDRATVQFQFTAPDGSTFALDYRYETDGVGRFHNDEIECERHDRPIAVATGRIDALSPWPAANTPFEHPRIHE